MSGLISGYVLGVQGYLTTVSGRYSIGGRGRGSVDCDVSTIQTARSTGRTGSWMYTVNKMLANVGSGSTVLRYPFYFTSYTSATVNRQFAKQAGLSMTAIRGKNSVLGAETMKGIKRSHLVVPWLCK
jgi:hypothetical protein